MKHIPPEQPPILKPSLTKAQEERREEVAKRTELISRGIPSPPSGIFGKGKPPSKDQP